MIRCRMPASGGRRRQARHLHDLVAAVEGTSVRATTGDTVGSTLPGHAATSDLMTRHRDGARCSCEGLGEVTGAAIPAAGETEADT